MREIKIRKYNASLAGATRGRVKGGKVGREIDKRGAPDELQNFPFVIDFLIIFHELFDFKGAQLSPLV